MQTLPCVAAAPAAVSADGQLRSGDVRTEARAADSGVDVVADRGAYATFAGASIRRALAGRWLYFFGDSSLRGVFLALLQQVEAPGNHTRGGWHVVDEWMRPRDPGGGAPRPVTHRDRDSVAMGWIDVILSPAGRALWLRSEDHDGSRGWRHSLCGPERSAELAAAWAETGTRGLRLTSVRGADLPKTDRGDAAAATWIFRGRRVAATPRLRAGPSAAVRRARAEASPGPAALDFPDADLLWRRRAATPRSRGDSSAPRPGLAGTAC